MFPENDARYKDFFFNGDMKQARMGLIISFVLVVLYVYNDYLFFGLSQLFYGFAVQKIAYIAFTFLLFIYFGRLKSYRQYYKIIFIWLFFGIIVSLSTNAFRPPSFLYHAIMVIIILFLICLVFPQKVISKIVLSLTITAGELVIVFRGYPSVAATVLFSICFGLVMTNLIGLLISKSMESNRRSAFENYINVLESEEKYRAFANSLPEIVFEAEQTGKLVFINNKAVELIGYSEEELSQMSIFDFFALEVRQEVKDSFQRSQLGDKSLETEYIFRRKDGSSFPVLMFLESLLFGKDKNNVRGIIINITETKKAVEEKELLNEKLRVVGSLTRHDVGNKLMVAKSNVHLLKKKIGDNPELTKYLDNIDVALASSNEIFEFSRLYERIGAENPSKQNVFECFNQAAVLMANLGEVNVINECQGLEVVADSLLKQLFYNFIDNSLKHGEKVTQIRLHYMEDKKGVKLFYEDNGVGVLEVNKPKLFEVGFTTGKGGGLGLYLVKKMMDVYDWNIIEEGESGKGAKFTITIPKVTMKGQENYQIVI